MFRATGLKAQLAPNPVEEYAEEQRETHIQDDREFSFEINREFWDDVAEILLVNFLKERARRFGIFV